MSQHIAPSAPTTVTEPLCDGRIFGSDSIELRIPARAEHVKVVRVVAAAISSRMKFSFDDVEDIKLAVAEACNNAILHATNTPSGVATPEETVDVVFSLHPDRLEICVADRGRLHHPDALSAPRAVPVEGLPCDMELPEGGLGLMLIRSLMDSVDLCGGPQDDTVVRMTKRTVPTRSA